MGIRLSANKPKEHDLRDDYPLNFLTTTPDEREAAQTERTGTNEKISDTTVRGLLNYIYDEFMRDNVTVDEHKFDQIHECLTDYLTLRRDITKAGNLALEGIQAIAERDQTIADKEKLIERLAKLCGNLKKEIEVQWDGEMQKRYADEYDALMKEIGR